MIKDKKTVTEDKAPVEPAITILTTPTTKERFFELLDQYPENKLVKFADILDSEEFKNEHGKKIRTGTLSKWKNKRFKRL